MLASLKFRTLLVCTPWPTKILVIKWWALWQSALWGSVLRVWRVLEMVLEVQVELPGTQVSSKLFANLFLLWALVSDLDLLPRPSEGKNRSCCSFQIALISLYMHEGNLLILDVLRSILTVPLTSSPQKKSYLLSLHVWLPSERDMHVDLSSFTRKGEAWAMHFKENFDKLVPDWIHVLLVKGLVSTIGLAPFSRIYH